MPFADEGPTRERRSGPMKSTLKLLVPYLAVLLFWCLLENAWATILVYHAQILLWSRHRIPVVLHGWDKRLFLTFSLPCLLGGPVAFLLLPYMTPGVELSEWLARFGLSGWTLWMIIPYFGIVHPLLEQAHWQELRGLGLRAHLAFAGCHMLVLCGLLHPAWLVVCFTVLFGASATWAYLDGRSQSGLLLQSLGHILADMGIVVAAVLRAAL